MPESDQSYDRSSDAPLQQAPADRAPILRFFAAAALLTGLIAAATSLPGCGSGSQELALVDPAAAPLHPAYTQVETILKRACAPCHKSSGNGTGTGGGEFSHDLDYTGCAGITSAGGIDGVQRSVFERGDMPPGAWPRLDAREQLILERWIADGAKGPCNP